MVYKPRRHRVQRWRMRRGLRCDGSSGSSRRPLVTKAHSCDSHVEDRLPTRGGILPSRAPHTWVSRDSLSTRTSPNETSRQQRVTRGGKRRNARPSPFPFFMGVPDIFFFPVAVVTDFWAVCVINHEDVSEWACELAWKISVCSKIMLRPTFASFFFLRYCEIDHSCTADLRQSDQCGAKRRETDWSLACFLPSFLPLFTSSVFFHEPQHSHRV